LPYGFSRCRYSLLSRSLNFWPPIFPTEIRDLSPEYAPSFFKFDPSGKTLARQLQLQNIPPGALAVGWMSRGQHYGMNFYLHEEIEDWNRDNLGKEYVLTDVPRCRNLTPVPFACEPVPFNEERTGVFLYHILMPGSLQGPDRGDRKVQKKE
jgi:hypothetical protein